MVDGIIITTIDDFEIEDMRNKVSFKVTYRSTGEEMFLRIIPTINSPSEIKSFIDHIEFVKNMRHQCFATISYAVYPDEVNDQPAALITNYYPNGSVLDLLVNMINTKPPPFWNVVHQFIILYGIANFMKFLSANNRIHGQLRASNILLNEFFEPKVTDIKTHYNIENETELEKIISMAPEVLINHEYTQQSDVFSFGILSIQIFKGTINIYDDKTNNAEDIKFNIINDIKPSIPSFIHENMKNIIIQCLEYDPNLRPSFQYILDAINSTVMLIHNEDTSVYWEYINKISDFEEKLSGQLLDIKREADKGDPSMMYLYANARLHGDECAINKIEALKYLKMASEQGHKESARTLRELSIERNSIPDRYTNCDSQILQDPQAKHNQTFNNEEMIDDDNSPLLSLFIDPYFKTEKLDFESVIQSVKENIRRVEIKEFPKVEETNFIFSEGAVDRLTKLSYYIECGVPVLLEGPTGTSKTLSTEIVCSLLGKRLERFNLSSETKAADLLGRYSGDESSWAGITHIDGPFVKAFRDGYCLLLDEINLASENVLQCIQESLDSGYISIEIPGMPLQEIKMNEGAKGDNKFCLVATQNPNKGLFAHKRQDLGLKLLSRFQVINFPSFEKVELLTIAEGLSQRFGYEDIGNVISHLVDFHHEWSTHPKISEDVHCFTIREIAATVKALSDGEGIFDAIMTIYGARYQHDIQKLLIEVFQHHFSIPVHLQAFEYP